MRLRRVTVDGADRCAPRGPDQGGEHDAPHPDGSLGNPRRPRRGRRATRLGRVLLRHWHCSVGRRRLVVAVTPAGPGRASSWAEFARPRTPSDRFRRRTHVLGCWPLLRAARTWSRHTSASPTSSSTTSKDGGIPSAKPDAREALRSWLSHRAAGWVRINNATSSDWSTDLRALDELPGLSGVMLANGESAHQVDDTAAQLPAQTPILALIESALGEQRAFDIASAASTPRLAFGSGDFRRDTGASDDATALAYARARLVVARRPAGAHRRTHGVRSRRAPRHRLGRHPRDGPDGQVVHAARTRQDRQPRTQPRSTRHRLGCRGHRRTRIRRIPGQRRSDLPTLAQAHEIRRLAEVFAGVGGVDN